ncbi:MAG: TIGR03936 family radical SAM-associated protein [Defluviitaleaceae bacterium]|nr:TIGR03936 family radical SAM-associated protein [Defluviitaleaceae bacterium]
MFIRYRIKFTKEGPLRFIGHLDTLALFQRVIRIVKLPIGYSNGFNPHPKTLFAVPLSLGIASTSEFLDIGLTEEVSIEAIMKMNEYLPEGLNVTAARKLKEHEKDASKETRAASYELTLAEPIKDMSLQDGCSKGYPLISVLEKSEILVEKKSKKNTKIVNIKPLIHSFSLKENILKLTLATGENNLNPKLVSEYLNISGVKYLRYDILKEKEGKLVSLWEE